MPIAAMMAESLCARMCHDLSNPLSALSGVIDLMQRAQNGEEAGKIARQAIQIMQERLKFFRAAWCCGQEDLTASEISKLCQTLTVGRRFSFETTGLTGRYSPHSARLILNLALLASDCAIAGTKITLKGNAIKGVHLYLINSVPERLFDLRGCLGLDAGELERSGHDPSLPELIAALVSRSRHRVSVTTHDDGHEIILEVPAHVAKPTDMALEFGNERHAAD